MTELTPAQLSAQLRTSARKVDAAVSKVVLRAALDVKDTAREQVASSNQRPADVAAFAARQIGAEMVGPLEAVVGYHGDIDGLAAALEYGSTTIGPGGQLSQALEREAPDFSKFVPLAALKVMR